MLRAVNIASLFIRFGGLTLIILGIVIWSGHGAGLVNAHMILGILFVAALWILAAMGAVVGVSWATVVRTSIWGVVVAWFGMLQRDMMVGEYHWTVRVMHLLIGMIAIGMGELTAKTIRERLTAKAAK